MQLQRSSRYAFLILVATASKYKFALFIGFLIGLVVTLGLFRIWPQVAHLFSRPTQHLGVVGEFSPSTLPLSIQNHISRGLTTIAPDGSAIPALATNWTVDQEGRVYTFTLDTTAIWHSGQNLEASDVNYNIRNVTFSATSTNTLIVRLEEPFSPFLTLLSKPIFQRGLKGVGDYKVSGIRLNGEFVNFLKLTPARDMSLPNLEYRFYRTEATAILAYKLGNIDIIEDLGEGNELSGWKNTTLEANIKNDRIVAIYFNVKHPLLSEKTIRQALAYGVPELEVARVQSPVNENSWAYSDRVREYSFDLERAKRLLGDTSGEVVITTFSPYLETAQKIAASWTDLGFTVSIKVENSLPADYQVLVSAQDIPPDPDQYPFWHQTQEQTNITGYANVKIDKLLEDGRREIDPEKRKIIYSDFQRYLTEDAPAVFLYHPTLYTVRRSR